MRRLAASVFACTMFLTLLASPSNAQDPVEYFVDEESLPFEAVVGFEDSSREWGVYRGAGYRYEVPENWNGELVMWAHGFRGTDARLFFNPEEVPFRKWLLENGYAWAASTYSENNYSVGNAVVDTTRLTRLFRREVKRPKRTYIAGVSMGGHVTAVSVEKYPWLYDGAMPVCGVVGDYELFDYFLDFNVAAQQIGLGESQFPAVEGYATGPAQEIKANLEAIPGGWPAVLNEKGESFKQLVELRSGGDRPNFDEAWFFWNSFPDNGSGIPGNFLFDLGTGKGNIGTETKVAVDNTHVFYETDLIPGPSNELEKSLNKEIVRVKADRGARRSSLRAASPSITGRIKDPVLTMHNLGDLFVPFNNEVAYYNDVAKRGRSHLLVQRAIRGSGHCGFTTAEYEQGFSDLVDWVEKGVRPEGDNVGDAKAVANPDFGCRFTDPTPGAHLFAAPCDPEPGKDDPGKGD